MAGVQNDATKGLKDGAREEFHDIAKGPIKKKNPGIISGFTLRFVIPSPRRNT